MTRKRIIIVNLILFVSLLSVLYFRFNKEQVTIDTNRGSEPTGFLNVLEKNHLTSNKQLEAFFIFSNRPSLSSLENIDKICHIYEREDIVFCSIFLKRFRLAQDFHFPLHFLTRYSFSYTNSFGNLNDSPCFLLIKGKRIVYADNLPEFGQLVKILSWQTGYDSYGAEQLTSEELRLKLVDRLRGKHIDFLNIYSREILPIRSIMSLGTEELYIIHAECVSCELNKLLSNIMDIRKKNLAVILSVRSNSYEIVALLKIRKTNVDVFVDYYDGLGLIHTEVSEKYRLFSFNRKEIL